MLHQPRLARRSQLLPQAGTWHGGEHTGTSVVAAASYRATSVCGGHASRVCGRASRAYGSAMQAKTEAGCVESDESVASFSVSAATIEEK